MERTRPLPIGCPVDRLVPVAGNLTDYEWLWVDAFAEGGQGYQHQPDQHNQPAKRGTNGITVFLRKNCPSKKNN